MAERVRRFQSEHRVPLPVEQVWALVSNTEHFNRSIGLPPVDYGALLIDPQRFLRQAVLRAPGPLSLRWRERPFEWVRPESLAEVREFENGPLRHLRVGLELESRGGDTVVRMFADLTPRGAWARPLAALLGRRAARDLAAYCRSFVERVRAGEANPLPRGPASRVMRARLDRAIATLREDTSVPHAAIEHLRRHLIEGTDEEILRMRPFVLADAWGADRDEVLRLFLFATREGLLQLDWQLMCPNCRVPKEEYRSLSELAEDFHCDLCGINYQADMDRYTELRFSVNPQVRPAEDAVYCIGSPSSAPHILIQQYLQPGEERVLSATLEEEALRARVLRANHVAALRPAAHAPAGELVLAYTGEGWEAARPTFRPGRGELRLINRGSDVIVAVIEREEWDPKAVTAAQVTARQEFRDLFSSEVLAPGRQIGVRSLCVLFTDLSRSTRLYELVGDAPAFGQVQRHFDVLTECARRNRGAIVKTIGDAVMAVFPTPAAAVRAAMEIHRDIQAFNRALSLDPPIAIKVGVHHGPAIAVNANDRLDYFGRTVNIASRIQNESRGGDVVLMEDLLQQPEIEQVLRGFSYQTASYETHLKDIEGVVRLCRLIPRMQEGDGG